MKAGWENDTCSKNNSGKVPSFSYAILLNSSRKQLQKANILLYILLYILYRFYSEPIDYWYWQNIYNYRKSYMLLYWYFLKAKKIYFTQMYIFFKKKIIENGDISDWINIEQKSYPLNFNKNLQCWRFFFTFFFFKYHWKS